MKMNDNGEVEAHFVTFYSPGTFVNEETTRAIPKARWFLIALGPCYRNAKAYQRLRPARATGSART